MKMERDIPPVVEENNEMIKTVLGNNNIKLKKTNIVKTRHATNKINKYLIIDKPTKNHTFARVSNKQINIPDKFNFNESGKSDKSDKSDTLNKFTRSNKVAISNKTNSNNYNDIITNKETEFNKPDISQNNNINTQTSIPLFKNVSLNSKKLIKISNLTAYFPIIPSNLLTKRVRNNLHKIEFDNPNSIADILLLMTQDGEVNVYNK